MFAPALISRINKQNQPFYPNCRENRIQTFDMEDPRKNRNTNPTLMMQIFIY